MDLIKFIKEFIEDRITAKFQDNAAKKFEEMDRILKDHEARITTLEP